MSRYTRNTVILAQVTADNSEPVGWVDGDAILVTEMPDHQIQRDYVDRQLLRGYMGGSDQLIKARVADLRYKTEFWGAGVAGSIPGYGRLLRMCGFAQTVTAASHVLWTPVSSGFTMGAILFAQDGVRYVSRGARGSVKFNMTAGDRPTMEFQMMGFDTNAYAAAVVGSVFGDWKRPRVINDANAGDIRVGCSLAGGTGAITGGTPLVSRGLEIDVGNKLSHIQLLGGEAIEITERNVTGSMTVELSPADEVAWRTAINNDETISLGFSYGTVAGERIGVYAPKVQRINPERVDYEGRVLFKCELRFLPTTAGNDELSIVAR